MCRCHKLVCNSLFIIHGIRFFSYFCSGKQIFNNMKKTFQFICAVALTAMIASCGGGKTYKVDGMLDDAQFEGKMVYLVCDREAVDSAVVKDGAFTFEGKADEAWIGTLYAMGETTQVQQDLIVEPGTIIVDLLTERIGGTPMNDSLQLFLEEERDGELEEEMSSYIEQYYMAKDAAERSVAEHMYDSLEAIATTRTYDHAMAFYNDNRDNILGAYAMAMLCSTDRLTYNQLNELLSDAADVVKNHKPVSDKLAQLKAIEETSAGKHYTDIEGVDGKLSDIIEGKLALVDFYASWCGPCRAEIRDNLVPLWAKYQNKGLVVVGLNVWERGDAEARKAAHEKVMADLGITYPQLVDSTRTATDTYGVTGIPQIMLIGEDGTILARDLRGAAIEEAVINALGK